MSEVYDVNTQPEVPVLTEDESFVLVRLQPDAYNVSLFNVSPEEAHEALLSLLLTMSGQ